MAAAKVKRYWAQLAELGCLVCGAPAEIAHCHGGSIVERMHEPKAKGKKLARMDWLVLPLCPAHGREPYPDALDTDVVRWEARWGTQAVYIDRLGRCFGLDLWALARDDRPRRRPRRLTKMLPRVAA